MRSRPVLATPEAMLRPYRQQTDTLRERLGRATRIGVSSARADLRGLTSHLGALSPQSTLERGYAVVQHADGQVVRSREDVHVGDVLRVRVAHGDFAATPYTGGPVSGDEAEARRTTPKRAARKKTTGRSKADRATPATPTSDTDKQSQENQ